MYVLVFGIVGLIVGSFLNVVIMRRGVRSLSGRSACSHCGTRIAWHDLIPVCSWIALRGRCRSCGSRISAQYPLVEATTGALFASIAVSGLSALALCISLSIAALLVCIAVYDFHHTIIPDEWVWACAMLSLLFALISAPMRYPIFLTFLFGPLAAAPLLLLWLVSGGRWMGLGDAKLALCIGWLLGPYGIAAVVGAFVLGASILVPAMGVARLVTHSTPYAHALRGLTMKSEVPFGPFLVTTALALWIFGMYGITIPLRNVL